MTSNNRPHAVPATDRLTPVPHRKAPTSPQNAEAATPKTKKRKSRDLNKALLLRPAEVFALYGIPTSTLCLYCTNPNPADRLKSILVPGRRGRKGSRYIDPIELRIWMERWQAA